MQTAMEFLKWLFWGAITILTLVAYATGIINPQDIGKGLGFGVMMLLIALSTKAIRRWRRKTTD